MVYKHIINKTVDGKKVSEEIEIDIFEGLTFSGAPLDEEKELRRFLRLPITKQLVYQKRVPGSLSEWEKTDVSKIKIVDKLHEDWFTLELDGNVKIHSWFFADMQKPSFAEDMKSLPEEE